MFINPTTLIYISAFFSLLPFASSLIFFKKIDNLLRPVFLLCLLSLIAETIGILTLKNTNVRLTNFYVYTLCEFTLLSIFFILFFRDFFTPRLLYAILVIYLLISPVIVAFYGVVTADHVSVPFESIVFTCYCLYLFYFVLKNLIYESLVSQPVFWINTGILFYFAGNLINFIFMSYIANHLSDKYNLLWGMIHTFFNILMNIFFSIGFWKLRTK